MHDVAILLGVIGVSALCGALGYWEGRSNGYCEGRRDGYREGLVMSTNKRRL